MLGWVLNTHQQWIGRQLADRRYVVTRQVSVPDAGPNAQEALSLEVARSQVTRGRQALEQGKPGEAIASFRAALANQPDLPEALRGLGMAHALQGKDAEANEEYERYLKIAPQGPEAAEVRRALSELKAARARR